MRILLDTCTFLWMGIDAPQLSRAARAASTDPSKTLFLSAVSAWEIAAKHALGPLPLPRGPEEFAPAKRTQFGVEPLAFDEVEALRLGRLPALYGAASTGCSSARRSCTASRSRRPTSQSAATSYRRRGEADPPPP